MLKKIDIIIDKSSWGNRPVPSRIRKLARPGFRDTNVLTGLLHTALWTRLPLSFGFSLSDCWAWLRYGPALANSSDLRLRREWEDIDSHQKTVLSDEMGVGFTTQLFIETLRFIMYADTQYLVKKFPQMFSLTPSAKRGPDKSPDYLALDASLSVCVLECKGGQDTRKKLIKSVNGGVSQKQNLNFLAGPPIKHSLTAGLFIPQYTNSENALIYIRDPEPDNVLREETSLPHDILPITIVQIGLVKHFMLMGLYSIADALLSADLSKPSKLTNIDLRERDILLSQQIDHQLIFEQRVPLPRNNLHLSQTPSAITFTMECPLDLYDSLVNSEDIADEIRKITQLLKGGIWKSKETEDYSDLHSPLGFNLSLKYEF